jgi:hypothetical protein
MKTAPVAVAAILFLRLSAGFRKSIEISMIQRDGVFG